MNTVVSGQPIKRTVFIMTAFILSVLFLLIASLWLGYVYDISQALLLLVGAALGLTLYHAAFGFTSSWRVFILKGRGRGLRVQMIMLAIAVLLFFPTLGMGEIFGRSVQGALAPLSVSVIIGAFIFGIGMQLGGGCASGVLFTSSGGNARMLIVLLFFIFGALLYTTHDTFWASLPSSEPISLVQSLGVFFGILISLSIFALIILITIIIEKRRYGHLEQDDTHDNLQFKQILTGPWPMIWGAIALALLNFITLILSGRPWGITGAFPLWGAKLSEFLGYSVSDWTFWQHPKNAKNLSSSVFSNVTSVMNFGIMAGAMLAATLAGRFAPTLKMPIGSFFAAIIGGLLLGYGSRIAYGCNIGAYFSGIASGSLHGWLWLASAFLGNIAGVYLRPYFFNNEQIKMKQGSC
ncbi:YeeE/YedE family protein [Bartonella tamiae]|uniref:Uncharacterized protein n=1 Tax=Bartonella tamiae Th239 TaxID=1094558 RepID=J1JZI0_9HYPH|nr:YeeE/YedE family protein [Bartonella tamiae]EJF90527.1 hypothetical protein ME5_00928 [Bartonella tamiae Th239]EJF93529.1 hypothetical protein MEG_00953 [Bartonella tamiae Th307]